MPRDISIKKEWQRYARIVMPTEACAVQVSETRRAFYAGAFSVYAALLREAETGISQRTLTDLSRELLDWLEGEGAFDEMAAKAGAAKEPTVVVQ